MSLVTLSMAGNNLIIPGQGELVNDIPAGDGKVDNLFYSVLSSAQSGNILSVTRQGVGGFTVYKAESVVDFFLGGGGGGVFMIIKKKIKKKQSKVTKL